MRILLRKDRSRWEGEAEVAVLGSRQSQAEQSCEAGGRAFGGEEPEGATRVSDGWKTLGFETARRHTLEKGKGEDLFKEQKISDAEAKGDWEHVGVMEGKTPVWPRVVFQVNGANKSAVVEPSWMMALQDDGPEGLKWQVFGKSVPITIALGYAVKFL
eukprot:jgi/Botrbrau1/20282/Bobra.31_1s0065.1